MFSVLLIIFSVFVHSGNSLKSQLDEYLKKNLTSYKDFKYEIVQIPTNYKHAEILKTNEFNVSGNLAYIPVKVIKEDKRITRSFITVRLKLFKNVLVAVKQINFKEHLAPADFRLEKKDITQIRGQAIESLKDIQNLRSKITIRSGDVLIRQSVETIPVINVGDVVKASLTSGSVYISTQATARQEGRPGDIIQIITKDKKLFKAKVINSHNVLIVE